MLSKIKNYQSKQRHSMFTDWKTQYCWGKILSKLVNRFCVIPIKLTEGIFAETDKLKLDMEM